MALRADGADLTLTEPDFDRDPFTGWREDISCTLRVQAQQNDILALAGAEPGVAALFQDKVVLAVGCLRERRVYLHRTAVKTSGDSGWYVGPVGGPKVSPKYKALYVYQLLRARPALVQVLALPPGYMVIFDGDEIEGWRAGE